MPDRPATYYWVDPSNKSNKDEEVDTNVFIDIIMTEMRLRSTIQRYERHSALIETSTNQGVNKAFIQKLKDFSEWYKQRAIELDFELYSKEISLPARLKSQYKSLRENPKWYCKKALIDDCKERMGCCSRSCGCCASRSSHTTKKGIGHCTLECACCADHRGFTINSELRKTMMAAFETLIKSKESQYLSLMANAFFEPLSQDEILDLEKEQYDQKVKGLSIRPGVMEPDSPPSEYELVEVESETESATEASDSDTKESRWQESRDSLL